MAESIWKIEYDVRKVNRDPHPMPDRDFRAVAEQMPRLIKQEAEQLRDRFDFAYVKVTAIDMTPGSHEKFEFIAAEESGFRDEWATGRQ